MDKVQRELAKKFYRQRRAQKRKQTRFRGPRKSKDRTFYLKNLDGDVIEIKL